MRDETVRCMVYVDGCFVLCALLGTQGGNMTELQAEEIISLLSTLKFIGWVIEAGVMCIATLMVVRL